MIEPSPLFTAKIAHYAEPHPNLLERSPKVLGRILKGAILSGVMLSAQAAVYGVSTFHTLATWQEPVPEVSGMATWASYAEVVEQYPILESSGTTSSLPDVMWNDPTPGLRGVISFTVPAKMFVRAPKSSMGASIEQARPLHGYFIDTSPSVEVIISRDGVPHDLALVSKNSKVAGAFASGSKGVLGVSERSPGCFGTGSVYSVTSSWRVVAPTVILASARVHSVVEIASYILDIKPRFIGQITYAHSVAIVEPGLLSVASGGSFFSGRVAIGGVGQGTLLGPPAQRVIVGRMVRGQGTSMEISSGLSEMRCEGLWSGVSQMRCLDVYPSMVAVHPSFQRMEGTLVDVFSFSGALVPVKSAAVSLFSRTSSVTGVMSAGSIYSAILVDTGSSIEGVSSEYISFR